MSEKQQEKCIDCNKTLTILLVILLQIFSFEALFTMTVIFTKYKVTFPQAPISSQAQPDTGHSHSHSHDHQH